MRTVNAKIPESQIDDQCGAVSRAIKSIENVICIRLQTMGLVSLDDSTQLLADMRHLSDLLGYLRGAVPDGEGAEQ